MVRCGAVRFVAVWQRTLFVRRPSGVELLTAWATSTAIGATCAETPCPPCGGLRCECPPPTCQLPAGAAEGDALDLAIVDSLRAI
jgi:hypothetical protein